MPNVWQLAFCSLQAMLLLAWLIQVQAAQHPVLWRFGLCGALICGLLVLWLMPKAYRNLLWRRRKSVRPSREVQAERRRIAAALHDRLGSQLVNTLAMAQGRSDSCIRVSLEQCLLDLRLIVDSMDSDGDSLSMMLARYRHRIQPVMDRREICLRWDVWDPQILGEQGSLPRGQMAQEILAFLQEAISNVLQHADAQEIWIRLAPSPLANGSKGLMHISLYVEDDGKGMVAPHRAGVALSQGMGMTNMQRRAYAIGGQLSIHARPEGGTAVHLSW